MIRAEGKGTVHPAPAGLRADAPSARSGSHLPQKTLGEVEQTASLQGARRTERLRSQPITVILRPALRDSFRSRGRMAPAEESGSATVRPVERGSSREAPPYPAVLIS
jgi:hypothetical protein